MQARTLAGVLVLSACGLGACATSLEREALMFRHFGQAHRIQAAAVFHRVDQAAQLAGELLEDSFGEGLPDGSASHVAAVRREAELLHSGGTADVAGASARLAAACGACHRENELGPRLIPGSRPAPSDVRREHMEVHMWATERLWEGLVTGSDEIWNSGAEALADQPLDLDDLTAAVSDRQAAAAYAGRVHRLGDRALSTVGSGPRAALLADVTAACGQCHSLAGVGY